MKRILYISLIVVLSILIILFGLPILFQSKIVDAVKTEINNNLNAKVEFSDLSLSLIKHFPDFSLELNDLTVVCNQPFDGDTLVTFSSLLLKLDLFTVISGDNISIKKIEIDNMDLFVHVLGDGTANWDITKESDEDVPVDSSANSTAFVISLKDFNINNSSIVYDDKEMDMLVRMKDINAHLAGDLSESTTNLQIATMINSFDLVYEGLGYFNSTNVNFTGNIKADLDNFAFTFLSNKLMLNQFPIVFEGDISMPEDDINMDIKCTTPDTKFKHILSLIPAIYYNDYKELETIGQFSFNALLKGRYSDNSIPAFDVNFKINNALFKYPGLPRSAENINVDMDLNNPGGNIDYTKLDINKFHIDLGQNTFDMQMLIDNPVNDPKINGEISANILFESLSDVIPLEDFSMKGKMNSTIKLMGAISDIEKEDYYKFAANGLLSLKGFEYKSYDLPADLAINNLAMSFSPERIILEQCDAFMGESDFSFKGVINNYLLWFFKDENLLGSLEMKSELINLNQLMQSDEEQADNSLPEDTTSISAIELPRNINFSFTSSLKKVYYDKLVIDNLYGLIKIEDGKLDLDKVSMDMLGGSMLLNGYYDSRDISRPAVDFSIDILNIDIPKTYESFISVQKLAPLAKYSNGKLSGGLTLNSILNKEMKPVLNTVNSSGKFKSKEIKIVNTFIFNNIADKLKSSAIANPTLQDVNINYEMKDGTIDIEPFKTKIAGYETEISGKQNIDGSIDYTLAMNIPRSALGTNLNSLIPGTVDRFAGENINVDIFVRGSLDKPEISFGTGSITDNAVSNIKSIANDKVNDGKDRLKEEADKQAEQILQNAQKQADMVKANARKAAEKIKSEADKKAGEVIDAAKNKSIIKKNLARKAANKIKAEGEKKAADVIKTADNKADEIMNKAKAEAGKI